MISILKGLLTVLNSAELTETVTYRSCLYSSNLVGLWAGLGDSVSIFRAACSLSETERWDQLAMLSGSLLI